MTITPLVTKNWVISRMNPKSFDVQNLRGLLMGNVICSSLGEVCAHILLFQDVKGGELPSYVPVLALQAQGVLILKMVDPSDKSVAMDLLSWSVVTFVCGHTMFVAIRSNYNPSIITRC